MLDLLIFDMFRTYPKVLLDSQFVWAGNKQKAKKLDLGKYINVDRQTDPTRFIATLAGLSYCFEVCLSQRMQALPE